MTRHVQEPNVTVDKMFGEKIEHPAFAVARFSRVSGRADLFGSHVDHQHYIQLEISGARMYRDGYDERIHGGIDTFVSVSMSEAQFATLVASMNHGSGTPCTIEHITDPGLYHREMPVLPPQRKLKDRTDEMAEMMAAQVRKDTQQHVEALTEILEKLPKKTQAEAVRHLESLRGLHKRSTDFHEKCLRETSEKVVSEAKVEMDAMLTSVVGSFGLQSVKELGAILAADPANAMKLLARQKDSD